MTIVTLTIATIATEMSTSARVNPAAFRIIAERRSGAIRLKTTCDRIDEKRIPIDLEHRGFDSSVARNFEKIFAFGDPLSGDG